MLGDTLKGFDSLGDVEKTSFVLECELWEENLLLLYYLNLINYSLAKMTESQTFRPLSCGHPQWQCRSTILETHTIYKSTKK